MLIKFQAWLFAAKVSLKRLSNRTLAACLFFFPLRHQGRANRNQLCSGIGIKFLCDRKTTSVFHCVCFWTRTIICLSPSLEVGTPPFAKRRCDADVWCVTFGRCCLQGQVVISLELMNAVLVDPEARVARVQVSFCSFRATQPTSRALRGGDFCFLALWSPAGTC